MGDDRCVWVNGPLVAMPELIVTRLTGGVVVFGIVRPCTHRLGEGLKMQWMAHLCGLCLALRGDHGQFARVVTNYDGLIISVLTEAQTAKSSDGRRTAGPCPSPSS